jgi:hypothetical protein
MEEEEEDNEEEIDTFPKQDQILETPSHMIRYFHHSQQVMMNVKKILPALTKCRCQDIIKGCYIY